MKFHRLTASNFIMFAIKAYNNPLCATADEFRSDMKTFSYLSKFLNKIGENDAPKYRLLLNHVTVLINLFGTGPTARMLMFYFPARHHPTLKTALTYLHALPDKVPEVDLATIPEDPRLAEFLRTIR